MTTHTTLDRRAVLAGGVATLAAAPIAAQTPAAARLPDIYPGVNAKQFRSFQRHENAHVAFILSVLGPNARPHPTFRGLEQPDATTFATVALNLENTGSGAYVGAAPSIFSRQVLDGALSIAEIEGRHCGFINSLFNRTNSTNVFGQEQNTERPLTQDEVRTLAGPFLVNLNGGPPFEFSPTPSRANDIAILNFALVLEYLEADFYNINVPKFFPQANGGS